MRNIDQIREDYNTLLERDEVDQRRLTTLIRSGLVDVQKLPLIKRALQKDSPKLSMGERKVLLDLLDALMDEMLHSQQVYGKVRQNVMHKDLSEEKEKGDHLTKWDPRGEKGFPSDKSIPNVLILKRKAIRIYPDQQKVALYYSQALDKYVTIPFGDSVTGINEENLYELSRDVQLAAAARAHSLGQPSDNDTAEDAARKKLKRDQAERLLGHIATTSTQKKVGKGKDAKIVTTHLPGRAGGKQAASALKASLEHKPNRQSLLGDHGGSLSYMAGHVTGVAAKGAIKGAAKGVAGLGKMAINAFKSKPKPLPESNIQEWLPAIPAAVGAVATGAARLATNPAVRAGVGAAASRVKDIAGSVASKGKRLIRKGLNKLPSLPSTSDSNKSGEENSLSKSLNSKIPGRKDHEFKLSAKTSTPGRSTGQGGFTSPAQEIKYRNAFVKENTIGRLDSIATSEPGDYELTIKEEKIYINTNIAKKLLEVYNSLNKTNKTKFVNMMNENKESFMKAANFAVRY